MDRRQASKHIVHCVDDALAIRHRLDMPAGNARLVGWLRNGETLFVAVWPYLGNDIRLDDQEASETATDLLRELGWFGSDGPRDPDWVL